MAWWADVARSWSCSCSCQFPGSGEHAPHVIYVRSTVHAAVDKIRVEAQADAQHREDIGCITCSRVKPTRSCRGPHVSASAQSEPSGQGMPSSPLHTLHKGLANKRTHREHVDDSLATKHRYFPLRGCIGFRIRIMTPARSNRHSSDGSNDHSRFSHEHTTGRH
jgi:hypothetical protein